MKDEKVSKQYTHMFWGWEGRVSNAHLLTYLRLCGKILIHTAYVS